MQHKFFLQEYRANAQELEEVIDWFRTLPLFIELDGFRVIHACWHQPTLDQFRAYLDRKDCLATLMASVDKDTFAYQAIETLLKGPQVDLPTGL